MHKSGNVLETRVETHLREAVERHGAVCLKFFPDAKRGMPDRVILLPGSRVVWVETKRPKGGRLSAAQVARHGWLRRLGHVVETAWDIEQADELVARLFPRGAAGT